MSTLIILIAAAVSMLALAIVASGISVLSIKSLKQGFADYLTVRSDDDCKGSGDVRIKVMPRIA
ncbi:MAG: hypothetical protein M3Q07_23845 [Pseudobdellovibrionaceae bacterium]|nr:hypothetical protein [Pseudobdellovibrionaceae bacterium]